MNYQTYFQDVDSLSKLKRQTLAELYFKFYAGSDIGRFLADLESKNEVLILEHNREIVGFSSLQFYPDRDSVIVYSGDTIVMPEHWKQQALHHAWIQRMGQLKRDNPHRPLYWFLLVKGYKTYKYLVVFAKQFHPHWHSAQPELKQLADRLAEQKFGPLYNQATGIVECPQSYGYLSQALVDLDLQVKTKPSGQFFLQRNPRYYQGHEMVCLCEISLENLPNRFHSAFLNPAIEYSHE